MNSAPITLLAGMSQATIVRQGGSGLRLSDCFIAKVYLVGSMKRLYLFDPIQFGKA
jgi:hypothetical protein